MFREDTRDWETRDGPNRPWRLSGDPRRQRRRVNKGSGQGPPQAWCRAWGQRVTGRDGTAYGEGKAEPAPCERASRAVAAGKALRRTARLVPIDQETACDWWDRAAPPGRQVLRSRGRDVPVTACPLDEWCSVVQTTEPHLAMAQQVGEPSGAAWRGTALAPVWRLVRAWVVGQRPQERAHLWRQRVAPVPAQRRPLCPSAQVPESRTARRPGDGPWVQPARHGHRGPVPAPRRGPPPEVL